jgi:hypothetical protein
MKKEHYTPPRILKKVRILLERDFLDSFSKDATMETAGQEVKEFDYGFNNDPATPTFNTQWE